MTFLLVAVVVIVLPGQDTALTIRNTVAGGRRAGLATAAGVSAGQLVWAAAASGGVAALIVAWEPAFVALKLAGAGYLVYLGCRSLWAALRGVEHAPAWRPRRAPFREGLVSNLANPKMAVFFTSLLPQFASSFAGLLALGLAFSALTLAWLCGYAVAVAAAGDLLRRSTVRRALDAATGAVLVALGVRVATGPR